MTAPQRVLVTGGTSSIGSCVVERLREQEARVAFTGRNRERGASVTARTGAEFVRADARDLGQVRDSVRIAADVLGGLDALVLAAGVLHVDELSRTPDEAWDALLETNVVAASAYAAECLPVFRAQGGGAIVTVSSSVAVWPDTSTGAYAVSKRALLALSEMLAVEGAPDGVRVNVVCPGDTASGMTASVDGQARNGSVEPPLPPLGRYTRPADVADAVMYFLSEAASFCTAATLLVDGGMRAADRAWTVARA